MEDQNKNLILATVLSALVIVVWFVGGPMLFPDWFPKEDPTLTALPAETATLATPAPAAQPVLETAPVAEAPRLAIDTPKLSGSVSLLGGRIDDLLLKTYRQTVDAASAPVTLLSSVGGEKPYYAVFGFGAGQATDEADVPGAKTVWTLSQGDTLAPGKPVTLTWVNTKGVTFTREISVDENYMFTIADTVTNGGSAETQVYPYGIIARHGLPKLEGVYVVHEGPVSRTDGTTNEETYSDMTSLEPFEGVVGKATESLGDGWAGFTDHYWMTTLIPEQGKPFTEVQKYTPGSDIYQIEIRKPVIAIAAGASATTTTRFFAGAKEWETIKAYEDAGVPGFIDSIDWGWFFFLTKPIFQVLHWMHGLIGNMGLAIIGLTFILKLLVLPLAYKSYVSMARMKELQPEMEAIKERAGEDKQKLQKDMMQLYRDKKVNPAAGCLPILFQIPIFFSLYKVIYVTIELRHAPFVGWLTDLSQPDTSSLFNIFGLLPWDAPATGSLLHTVFLGLLPILLGVSMWLQQKLNPAPTDPAQAMIMAWMPWVFMFMLGGFASGLVLYWITNNTITFIQQYLIMWSHGKRPDLMEGFRKKPAPAPVPVAKPKGKK